MNLICCNEHCKYQKDGYCFLENPGTIYISESDCCYYEPKNKKAFDDDTEDL